MGLFGGSSKSRSTTNNSDSRISQQGGTAVSGDANTVNVLDGGAVAAAFDAMAISDATNAQNFTNLLDLAGGFFDKSERLIGQTQSAVADAYGQAQTDKGGTIDNRTLIALAAAAVVALIFINRRKGA